MTRWLTPNTTSYRSSDARGSAQESPATPGERSFSRGTEVGPRFCLSRFGLLLWGRNTVATPSPPTELPRRRNHGGGEGAVCQILIQIAKGQRGHRRARGCRGATHMRQHNDVVHLPELLRHIRF